MPEDSEAPNTSGLDMSKMRKATDESALSGDYAQQFSGVRVRRDYIVRYKELAAKNNVMHYGNLMNEVLRAFLDGELINVKKKED